MAPRVLIAVVLLCAPLLCQHRVNSHNRYERALCVVPMVGAGTPEDPRRPAYAPLPNSTPSADGIIAFSYQESDDGQFALVEFVARNRDAFKELLADSNPAIKVFFKGQDKLSDITVAFQKLKRNIDVESLRAVAP
jgi:hypothetical protein